MDKRLAQKLMTEANGSMWQCSMRCLLCLAQLWPELGRLAGMENVPASILGPLTPPASKGGGAPNLLH